MKTQKIAWLNRWVVGSWSWWRLGRSLLLIYVTVCLYVWFTADRKIFLPPPATYAQMSELMGGDQYADKVRSFVDSL
ncbi:MAG: hypothetical protein SFY66_03040 [Oculatellaceae cyanobacterium bins.114]|nr:hypothetical protein [Oculatellaceae cyanobacterium bins.114]